MGLRLSIVGGALVAKSARALLRPPAVARRAITTKRTDWAGEARSVCQGATEETYPTSQYRHPGRRAVFLPRGENKSDAVDAVSDADAGLAISANRGFVKAEQRSCLASAIQGFKPRR